MNKPARTDQTSAPIGVIPSTLPLHMKDTERGSAPKSTPHVVWSASECAVLIDLNGPMGSLRDGAVVKAPSKNKINVIFEKEDLEKETSFRNSLFVAESVATDDSTMADSYYTITEHKSNKSRGARFLSNFKRKRYYQEML